MWELSKKLGCAFNEIEQIERGLRQPAPKVLLFLENLLAMNSQETIPKIIFSDC